MRTTLILISLLAIGCVASLAGETKTEKARKELNKAERYAVDNKFPQMLEAAKKAQALDPLLPGPFVYSAIYFYRSEQPAAAEQDLLKALARDPNLALAHIYLGNILFDRGESERALDEWNVGVRLDDRVPEGLSSLAVGLLAIGRTTDAMQHYRKALMYDRRYYDPPFLIDRKKGAAWSQKKVDAVTPLLAKLEKPGFPY